MKELRVTDLEEGQRFDRFLEKYLSNAGKGFLYKMLRKKNITLNDKKASGSEKLKNGDIIKIFFKDETISAFMGNDLPDEKNGNKKKSLRNVDFKSFVKVLYEDDNIILVDKPKNVLSQKADKNDLSMCEYITAYLLDSGALSDSQLETFRPGVCNRLDRNTSGVLAAGKTVKGLQELSYAFAQRTLDKYYIAIVAGNVTNRRVTDAYILKDEKTNKVVVSDRQEKGMEHIVTEYIPVAHVKTLSLVKIHLHTGKTHQIRAHMAYCGYPLVGDYKYGSADINAYFREKYKVKSQLLHSFELIIPDKSIDVISPLTEEFVSVLKGEGLWRHGIQEDLEALR